MSYPAANALPLVGVLAVGDIFLTNRGGEAESGATAGGEVSCAGIVLGRFARGELGKDGA